MMPRYLCEIYMRENAPALYIVEAINPDIAGASANAVHTLKFPDDLATNIDVRLYVKDRVFENVFVSWDVEQEGE